MLGRLALGYALIATSTQPAGAADIPPRLQSITHQAEPFVGVTYYQVVQTKAAPQPAALPRPLAIHVVEIDPRAPGVQFFAAPGNGDEPHEYTRRTTSEFVAAHQLALAINGDFYATDTGQTTDVNGLGISEGAIASPPAVGDDRDNSLVILKSGEARIISDPVVPVGAWNAVSGNQLILRDVRVVAPRGPYTTALNPHTAVGVDADTGHVFFLVVDGRQPGFSEGMQTGEIARLLREFGVDDAINLDGGGSSTLVFADGPAGAPRTINSPSDESTSYVPGRERQVANHLGVFARPHAGYRPLPPLARPAQSPELSDKPQPVPGQHPHEP